MLQHHKEMMHSPCLSLVSFILFHKVLGVLDMVDGTPSGVTSGHSITLNNFSIVGREEQNLSRLIKESMFIRVNNPSLNKSIGKYHLPHI